MQFPCHTLKPIPIGSNVRNANVQNYIYIYIYIWSRLAKHPKNCLDFSIIGISDISIVALALHTITFLLYQRYSFMFRLNRPRNQFILWRSFSHACWWFSSAWWALRTFSSVAFTLVILHWEDQDGEIKEEMMIFTKRKEGKQIWLPIQHEARTKVIKPFSYLLTIIWMS